MAQVLLREAFITESEDYLNRQLITYLGNKRSLLDFIGIGINKACASLNKHKLSFFDVFSGSGVVSRFFKQYASLIVSCDMEKYAEIIGKCYLANFSEVDKQELREYYFRVLKGTPANEFKPGFISELYAPRRDDQIEKGERVFYTRRNAAYLDTVRQNIEEVPEHCRHFLLAPLLSEASIHANTSGVFKGFYKDKDNGIGKFGGKKGDALSRILGDIELPFPLFSNFECETEIFRGDSNEVAELAPEVDLAYLDPPYNQHPYGSNYFMLNLLAEYKRPGEISQVSGIPADWNRSAYNKKAFALSSLKDLARKIKAKFLLISFNSEGFIAASEMKKALGEIGKVEALETKYNVFRGSRNLRNRKLHVKEFLFLVKKR